MKILLIGASGQLGTDLVAALSRHQLVTPPRHTLDVLRPDQIRRVLQSERPRVVINTAAFHQVDACESEVLTAFQANGEAVRNLGLAARDIDAALVHYSTDYVFDGSAARPYLGKRPPPSSQRLRRLQAGGRAPAGIGLAEAFPDPHQRALRPRRQPRQGRQLRRDHDPEGRKRRIHPGGPRPAADPHQHPRTGAQDRCPDRDLLLRPLSRHLRGELHLVRIRREIFRLLDIGADLAPTTSDSFAAAARRPAYSVLANHRLDGVGMDDLKHWKDALRDYLSDRIRQPGT